MGISRDELILGPRHRSALALLREGDSSIGSLASDLDLNFARASGIVADLERAGFAERMTDTDGRRRTIVRTEPGSESVVDAWIEGATAPIVRALQLLSPYERAERVKAMGLQVRNGLDASCGRRRDLVWGRRPFCDVQTTYRSKEMTRAQTGLPAGHQALAATPTHGLGMLGRLLGSGFNVTVPGLG